MAEPFPSIYTEILPTGQSFPMRLIPGGVFDMGSPETDKEADSDEKPLRRNVRISSFYMASYQLTQQLWEAVMGDNPARFKGSLRPVESVSWYEVKEFIKKLNDVSAARRAEHGFGDYRLPTEAEWEYAARAGTEHRYPYAGGNKLDELGWFRENSERETWEVGLLRPNLWGLYDMSGNVWEWCEDHWHGDYRGAPEDGRAWLSTDPDARRVLRGGGFFDASRNCRVAFRTRYALGSSGDDVGFRLALSSSFERPSVVP